MKTVMVYRLGSLGDTVVALPCFHRIAERFPEARRVALTNRPVSPAAPKLDDILRPSGLIHETIEYDVGTRSLRGLLELRRTVRACRPDTLIYLAAPRGRRSVYRDLVFFKTCGIPTILGAPLADDVLTNRTDPVTGEEEHECERLARSVASLGPIDLDDRRAWDLRLTPEERAKADALMPKAMAGRLLAVNMGGKAGHNDWGAANWQAALEAVTAVHPDLTVLFVGAKQDHARAEAVGEKLASATVNLCGQLTPRETAAVLVRADLFAGHDTGPLHLAAACRVTCIGLFSPLSKPHKWHPYGRGHVVLRSTKVVTDIPVDAVRTAILDGLAQAESRKEFA